MTRTAFAAACALCAALAGCRTTDIGGPIEIPIPHNISERDAQYLVTRFLDRAGGSSAGNEDDPLRRLFAGVQWRGSVAQRYRGKWRIEDWQPGSLVAAYAWKSHLLRIHVEFRDRVAVLGIGESTGLRQSQTEIHKTAKALTDELAQDIRFVFGKVASGDSALVAAVRSQGSSQPSFCDVMGGTDDRERDGCRRAQRDAYERLQARIERVESDPTAPESRKLKACYAQAQTRAGTDWEATARCFYAYPASMR
jgi:glutathione S-transferase